MPNEFGQAAYVGELEAVGVPGEQAAIHGKALKSVLSGCVSSHELAALRIELLANFGEFRVEFGAFRTEIYAKISSFESSLQADLKIVAAEVKLLRWIVGLTAGLQIAVLVKLILP